MATKLQFYQAVADKTIHDLTLHSGNWMRFLNTAANLYKYPFQDQLMIYTQRPDATACAELEFWNEKFNRWVRRGSKGIALIDDSGSYPRLKYVFDVSDTEASLYRARPVQLWEMTQEHKTPVLSELAKNYEDIDADGTLAEAFCSIAAQLAHEYYEDNYREILYNTENSMLEPPTHYDFAGTAIEDVDDSALRAAFEESLANSIAYTVMARCGLDTQEHFDISDFQSVIDFNTPDMVHALGVATAELTEQVLRDIEITIRKFERVKGAERSEQSYDRNPYLHNEGRLSAPGHQTERTADGGSAAPRQIREDEESVPQRPQEDNLQQAPVIGEAIPASEGSGRGGEPEVRADNDLADSADQSAEQGNRPDEVDGGDEHLESASGGSHSERTDLRVEPDEAPSDEGGVSVSDEPPSLSQVETTPISAILSTSPVSMDEVDSILRDGGNFDSHKLAIAPYNSRSSLRIAARFVKGLEAATALDDNAEFLKREYLLGRYGRSFEATGKGFDFGNHKVSAWFDEDGISLAIGTTAKNNIHRVTIPWESAAARIEELMREGRYISSDAFNAALDNERSELADRLWFFYRDNMGEIPDDFSAESGGHPGDHALIKSLLENESEQQRILERLESDVETWRSDPERQTWRASVNTERLLGEMRAATRPPILLPADDFEYKRNFSHFITQDEIDALITHGGSYSEGKFRFLSFFLGDHDEKEKLDFIKREYGHGGGTWGATDGWRNAEPGKGLSLQRGGSVGNPEVEINLKWSAVIKRTEQLIQSGQYMTRAELDRIPNYERLMLMRQLQAFFRELPEEYERPFAGLDFHYPHEAEWEALRDLLDNPERVVALLAVMEPIYLNTIEEDRYYNTRKTAWDNLNAYRDGEYTLFPGLENLPEPGTPVARRWNDPPVRRETVIDLNDSPPSGGFSFAPTQTVQMSLFDFASDSPLPILPSVEEQRAKIDDTLKQEAATVEANADAPFLSIADADMERIAAQFTTAPRSREAVELVKEVYGDSLNMPLPQAIKRLTELVAEGKFATAALELNESQQRRQITLAEVEAVKSEHGGAMVAYQIGDFFELYGVDARVAADTLGLSLITLRDLPAPTDMVGFPNNLLGEYARTLNEAGHALAVSSEREDGSRSVFVYPAMATVNAVEYNVGDKLTYGGKSHEIDRVDGEYVRLHNLGNPAPYPVFDYISIRRADFERMLSDGELTIANAEHVIETEQAPDNERRIYAVGDLVWLDGRRFSIDRIGDDYKQPDDLDRRFNTFGRSIELTDITGGYPIGRSIYQAELDSKLGLDERNSHLIPLGEAQGDEQSQPPIEETVSESVSDPYTLFEKVREELSGRGFAVSGELIEDGINEYNAHGGRGSFQDVADFIEDEFLTEEPPALETPVQYNFDAIAAAFYEEVLNDRQFAEVLANATSRAALRRPLGGALDAIIAGYEPEPHLYGYLTNDDVADNLFDYIYRRAWVERVVEPPQTETAAQMPEVSDGFTEITDPDEVAEIEAIFGGDTSQISVIVGQRVVLDLRDRFEGSGVPDPAILAGEFVVDAIDGGNVTVGTTYSRDGDNTYSRWNVGSNNERYTVTLTSAEIEAHSVKPIMEKLHEETSPSGRERTDYYILRYPDGIDAGAGLSVDELALVAEQADTYVICAEACFLSENDMERFNIGFRKMPRDWNLLPEIVQDQIRTIEPIYEQQWNEMYGARDSAPEPPPTPEPPQTPAQQIPRYEIKQLAVVEHITSSPPSVGLLEPGDSGRRYGVYDNEANRYLRNPDDTYISFHTQAEARAYIDSLTKGENFRIIDDHLGEGGAKTKFRSNILALQTLKTVESERRAATPEEQEILHRYVGWGGLPQAFDPDNKDWAKEYAELSAILTPDEFSSARESTLNAHYTTPIVIRAMWETMARLGFEKGNILEPSMGVGNFYGLIPDSMSGSKLYGVELDDVTARIAQKLYPHANIQQTGFEKTDFPDAFFDLAIGNVPFGSFGVVDKRYDKYDFSIHNYFFAKALDKVRPGGVVAFVTSKFTMDERNPQVRKYLAERADLLGAVRLPNNAFLKNAGTETTMDILFLQKRDRPLDVEPEWVHLGLTEDGIPVNRYYLENPNMVLGLMGLDEHMNNKYGRDDYTACLPIPGADLAQQLSDALANIEGEYTVVELDDLEGVDNHAIPADPNIKNFSYAVVDDTVYFRENSLMYPVDLPATTLERIKGMIGLRDCVGELINLQLDDYATDEEIAAQQQKLNTLYDGFVAEFGLISSTANSRAFNADSAYYLLSSLEIINEDGELERKADMFTKRTIKQKTVVTHVDTSAEALAVSIGERARVDLEYMSELTGKDRETLLDELRGVIFLNIGSADSQEKTYVTADEYLSGNIREKLMLAEAAAQVDPSLRINVEALRAVMPKDLEANEINVRLGATWIDPKYVQEFMYELLNTSYYNKKVYQVQYHGYTGEWQVAGKNRAQYSDIPATVTYGTRRMNAYQILEDTLNLRDVRVYDRKEDADGKEHRVLNKKETMLAQQKQEIIKQAFRDWIWKDPERRQTLVALYNEKFNSVRPREYDGSHITFNGISQDIELRPHQLNAIAHILYGGNTLLAHEVGAGKTFEMVAAAMESKRLGQCHKSLFAVPNHITEQWAAEFLRLYPSANILVATKKDFEMRNRKKFCAKIATGDYDAVIIGHSQLEKIPMSRERQERQIREQIWEIEEGIRELKASRGDNFSIKQLEKTKRSLNNRLTKLLDSKKRDDVVTFEQLGCDRLFIDEAHNFKNLFLYTKMRNVAGLSTSEAQKSSDLFMKCRYLDELTDNKGVIFATGTPISNSMTEMFTMQRYLQHDRLKALGLLHFDSWASIFGETQTSIELAPEGTGYRARTRFAKFHNLPELMAIFKDVADIQTADMLCLPVPEAKFENIIVEPSDLQKEMVEELSERAAAVHRREVDPQTDNMLKITTDGRKIGLDQRLMNPLLPDFEGSKVNACTDKVFEIWQDTSRDRLTQLVFCDFSTPKKDQFNVYDDIKAKLIARGIPEHEIAFIHDADTETKKKELFAKVRQGKVRVLFGSTFKMGSGTNVQDRLIAIHDADCPWRPADLAQRAGRIVRQGNRNAEVQIYRYATSGTFDSYLWQTVQKKQEFIAQIMSSKSPVRSCDDIDETALSYAEIKALCAGNPLIAEKMQLDNEVAKLRMLKSEHRSQHYRLEDSLLKTFPQQIAAVTERIAGIEKDIAMYAAEKEKCTEVKMTDGAASVTAKFPGMTINGVTYCEKEPAAKALLEACKGIKGRETEVPVGEFMGFKLSLSYASFGQTINLMMRGVMTYQTELGTDAFGNITRITNALDKLPERLEGSKTQLENLEKQVAAAKEELSKPFALEDELKSKEARLALLNADLNIDGDGGLEILNDTEESRDEKAETVDEIDERDESDDEVDYEEPEQSDRPYELANTGRAVSYGYGGGRVQTEPQRTGTYGKSAPSILDDVRSIKSELKPPTQGGKPTEIDI